jgi:hypothetical protein
VPGPPPGSVDEPDAQEPAERDLDGGRSSRPCGCEDGSWAPITVIASTAITRQLRALVAAEARCCPFLQFGIDVERDALELTIRAPAEARPIIDDLFGRPRV